MNLLLYNYSGDSFKITKIILYSKFCAFLDNKINNNNNSFVPVSNGFGGHHLLKISFLDKILLLKFLLQENHTHVN